MTPTGNRPVDPERSPRPADGPVGSNSGGALNTDGTTNLDGTATLDGAAAVASGARPPSSALSVAQAAALRRLGLVPAGFVMGTAVVQVVSSVAVMGGSPMGTGLGGTLGGFGSTGGAVVPGAGRQGARSFPCAHAYGYGGEHWGFNAEDAGVTTSIGGGYDLVIGRLVEEARQLGAHGVVGVELTIGTLVGGANAWTFRAVGTAVVHPGLPAPATPFATTANGQHVERLLGLGLAPVALATGVGACFVQPNCRTRGDPTTPGVVDQVPHALDVARQRAHHGLAGAAQRVGGDGVVDTTWRDSRLRGWGEAWIQTATATGTVVRRFAEAAHRQPPRPVVSLRP